MGREWGKEKGNQAKKENRQQNNNNGQKIK